MIPASNPRRPWAVFDASNRPRRVLMAREEADVWVDFFGWCTPERIAGAKAKGFRAACVNIIEVGPEGTRHDDVAGIGAEATAPAH